MVNYCDLHIAVTDVPPCFWIDTFWLNVLILKMYEINTLLLLPLKIYLIVLKHIKSLILLKKLVFISNFVFILMFVICLLFVFYSSLIALIIHS